MTTLPILQFFLADDVFWQLFVAGLSTGSVYGLLALGLVLIYRTTRVINLAQAEMAMFSTYLAWSLLHRLAYWQVFIVIIIVAALMGALVERLVMRPVEKAPPLIMLIVTLALFSAFNGVTLLVWKGTTAGVAFPTLVADNPVVELGGVRVQAHSLAIMGVTAAIMAILYVFFQFTQLGLALRAVAQDPLASRLSGIRVANMLMLGWGLSTGIGAVGGMMIAPLIATSTAFIMGVFVFALTAMVLGGMDSPPGVVLAGLIIGVTQNLYIHYTPQEYLGSGTEMAFALVLILAVLMVRPQGLLGERRISRI